MHTVCVSPFNEQNNPEVLNLDSKWERFRIDIDKWNPEEHYCSLHL